jgi:transposase
MIAYSHNFDLEKLWEYAVGKALIAIDLISGSVNTAVFTYWVGQVLLPNLPKESVVVMDKASFHKGK